MLNEKSVTKTQQRLFGQAYAVKLFKRTDGKKGLDPKDINPKYKQEILHLADNMSLNKLKEFAETKHKNLPEEVKEGILKDIFYKLTPDSQYDDSKAKSRQPGHLVDYREYTKKNKKNNLDATPKS